MCNPHELVNTSSVQYYVRFGLKNATFLSLFDYNRNENADCAMSLFSIVFK